MKSRQVSAVVCQVTMTVPDRNQNSTRFSRCMISGSIVVISVVFVVGVVVILVIGHRLSRQQARIEWRQKFFNRVKQDGVHTGHVIDALMLPMFAGDEECVSRIDALLFDMVTVTPELAAHVAQLKNVQRLSFYDTRGAEHVLANARNLPIRSIFFHQAGVPRDSLRSLADFPSLKAVYFQQVLHPDEIEILNSLPSTITVVEGFPPSKEVPSENRVEQSDAHRSTEGAGANGKPSPEFE